MSAQPDQHRPDHPTAEVAVPVDPANDLVAIEITGCPVCEHPAEIIGRNVLPSTSGPVEHVKVRCLSGHGFLMPVELLGQHLS